MDDQRQGLGAPAAPNLAVNIDSRAEVIQAKAEMAIVLAESFREDINSLRDALQHANHIITALQAENAVIRAALARADPHFHRNGLQADPDAIDDANDADQGTERQLPASQAPKDNIPPKFVPPRPDMQCVPPEGTIFSNGGPYSSAKTGERSNHNAQLKKELNDWTRERGYSVKIYRSRLEKKRAKLIISCVLAGRPKRIRSEEEEQQRREQAQEGGSLFRRQRLSKLSDCPLKFSLLEMVEGSGTFLVKHVMDPNAQHCNHERNPTVFLDSDTET